jgi:hypothetical protein
MEGRLLSGCRLGYVPAFCHEEHTKVHMNAKATSDSLRYMVG